MERPFRIATAVPIVFLATSVALVLTTSIAAPGDALVALCFVIFGGAIYVAKSHCSSPFGVVSKTSITI